MVTLQTLKRLEDSFTVIRRYINTLLLLLLFIDYPSYIAGPNVDFSRLEKDDLRSLLINSQNVPNKSAMSASSMQCIVYINIHVQL